jgi:hypothetical protein
LEIQLTSDQILAMAPDASAAAAGKKHGNVRLWKNLGMSAQALWGECLGSALYQVRVELASLTTQCSCPSRKLPCKHSLGLLMLAATEKAALPLSEPPEWVSSWLAKRQVNSTRQQERREKKAATDTPSAEQRKTAEKRLATVRKGLDGLDLWLNDLVRQGLASVQTQSASFWERQAARLRDAQAPSLDTRVRRLAAIPNASANWPEKLLAELGKLALLTHAFRLEDHLSPQMREEVRLLIGWNLNQEEVSARGETVRDTWLIAGQVVEEAEHGKAQRTWFYGSQSARQGMVLQFSYAGQPFGERFAPGSQQEAELTFWPGSLPLRAQVRTRLGELTPLKDRLPGCESITIFLESVAQALGRQPWLEHFLALLRAVTPVCSDEGRSWAVCDKEGHALPLDGTDHWPLLALSGGYPVDLAAEWDGETLRPLGVMAEGEYTLLGRTY